jgi:DNA-binding NtrC family response regulator
LRERKEDIPFLVEHLLSRFATEMGKDKSVISEEALVTLMSHHFAGNVRELANIIERAIIESRGGDIQMEHLHFTPPGTTLQTRLSEKADRDTLTQKLISGHISYSEAMNTFQRSAVREVLESCGGDKAEAARRMKIHRPNLNRLLKRLNID